MQQGLKDIEQEFMQFLVRHNAYGGWLSRLETYPSIIFQTQPPYNYLRKAFNWGARPRYEGASWVVLDVLWQEYLEAKHGGFYKSSNTTYTPAYTPKVTSWSDTKSNLACLFWRLKFKRVQFYTLNNASHCTMCDAKDSCPSHNYVIKCTPQHQLKLRRKK